MFTHQFIRSPFTLQGMMALVTSLSLPFALPVHFWKGLLASMVISTIFPASNFTVGSLSMSGLPVARVFSSSSIHVFVVVMFFSSCCWFVGAVVLHCDDEYVLSDKWCRVTEYGMSGWGMVRRICMG